ncbi:MAG: hypothetical protein H3Z52_09375, partial [archaeon]|nr:hypothetical protein [archaeon]MCP8321133.1 hypothetical protein [archaeon]
MPKPLSEQDKEKVVEEYLKNQPYRKICESTNVSLGAVSTVINEAKSIYPDLDLLRDIRSKLPQDIDIPTLHKTILAVLEFQNVIQIALKDIPSYIEDKQKGIKELSANKDNLTTEIQGLESKRESLQSEVKELSDKKTQLGKDIQEYEQAKKHLSEYGINITDIDRLRSLLDNINKYGLDPEKCVSVIEEHELLFKEIQGMRSELGEMTMFRDAFSYSMMLLEEQHTEKGLQLRLKTKAIDRRDAEIQELDGQIEQLKGELQKLENRKEAIIAETS